MEKKIGQFNEFDGLLMKNLQKSIRFWRFFALNQNFNYSSCYKRDNFIKEIIENSRENDTFPKVDSIDFNSQKSFEKITKNLVSYNRILPKLLLVDNIELGLKIKNLFLSSKFCNKGTLPSIQLISNFESFQESKPVDSDSGLVKPHTQQLIELIEKVPFLDSNLKNQSSSALELVSDWLKIISRWEWLEESWRILGSPSVNSNENIELGSLEYLFMLKNALRDNSNPAIWHKRQFDFAIKNQSNSQFNKSNFYGVVMVLNETCDPIVVAKSIILARQKVCNWNIFFIKHPIDSDVQQKSKTIFNWKAWEKNFPLIWPEVFDSENFRNNRASINSSFQGRRQQFSKNSNEILQEWDTPEKFKPLRCIEVKSLESMTEASITQIKIWLGQKKTKLGIVALDRRATRRLLAKLNQRKIYVEDKAGWSLDTSIVSLSIVNLLKIICGQFTNEDFYYWINVPLVIRALTNNQIIGPNEHVDLNKKLKDLSVDDNISGFLPSRLSKIININDSKSIAENLITALKKTGIEEELLEDSAGQVALKVCKKLAVDLSNHKVNFTHFLNLIESEFKKINFSVDFPESVIKIISFQQAIWNPPDAILIIGGTSQNMPNFYEAKFVDSVSWEKIAASPSKMEIDLQQLKNFVSVLGLKIPVVLIGKPEEKKDFVIWSRWIERIRMMAPNSVKKLIFSKYVASSRSKNKNKFIKLEPNIYIDKLPYSISVSSIKSMIECPYKFFWESIFGLKKTSYFGYNDEHKEVGISLHLLMEYVGNSFKNSKFKNLRNYSEKDWFDFFTLKIKYMNNIGLITFETSLTLRNRIKHLSIWCSDFFNSSFPLMIENKVSGKLPKSSVLIKGKIDRVEEKKDKAKTKILIDYKSSKIVGLNTELQSAQILIYLWLLKINKINISKAGYLCITNKESKWLEVDKIKAEELVKKISLALTEIEKGHPIKPIAAKSGQICKSCSVRAVCRKDEWMLYKSIL